MNQEPTRIVERNGQEIVVRTPGARPSTNDYYTLKAKEKELQNQLDETQGRREDLAQLLSQKSGNDRAGIEGRIATLDTRLAQLEGDLATVGREVAGAAPASIARPAPEFRYRGYNEGDMFGAGFAGAVMMFTLFIPFLVRNFRRRKFVPPGKTTPAIASEKIDRMEQSIETIAVEIERVSENQRFMTKLITETQLAGTIAAVRASTEAAKQAAESGANA